MKNFRDLTVWSKAHELTLKTYRITAGFPPEERYSLTVQMRRSSASIPTNIAEGCGRRGNGDFHQFLQIASGSASELAYQYLLACDLGYISREQHSAVEERVMEVQKMLAALIKRVEADRLAR